MSEFIVETSLGKVQGHREGESIAFRGIPYGGATGGRQRFLPPKAREPWSGVFDADDFGPIAPQVSEVSEIRTGPWLSDYSSTPSSECDEDCLSLNVWTPSLTGDRRPVMVWLHGGGFTSGSSGKAVNIGDRLAPTGDVVVVSVNHRLGLLGHLELADVLGEQYASSGNAGLLDIVLALHWVRENIHLFGGDAHRVMIFGVSGGGCKVASLLAMPSAEGLFKSASMESGSMAKSLTHKEAGSVTKRVLDRLGIAKHNLRQLNDLPWPELLKAQGPLLKPGIWNRNEVRFRPVVDGAALTVHPFFPKAAPSGKEVPTLIGTTKDEMTVTLVAQEWFGTLTWEGLVEFTLSYFGDRAEDMVDCYRSAYPEMSPSGLAIRLVADRSFFAAATIATRRSIAGAKPTYLWRWDYTTQAFDGVLGAYHGMVDSFVFRNIDRSTRIAPREGNVPMMDMTQRTWVKFASTGNPNHDDLPTWSPYNPQDRCAMIFDRECRLERDFLGDFAKMWGDVETTSG